MLYSFNINLPKAAVCTRAYQETEDFMKRIFRHFISAIVSMTILLGAALSFNMTVSANPSIGNGIILSDDVVALSEGTSFTIAAALGEGLDASRLTCVSANPGVATVTPVASMANIANFQIDYAGNGSGQTTTTTACLQDMNLSLMSLTNMWILAYIRIL